MLQAKADSSSKSGLQKRVLSAHIVCDKVPVHEIPEGVKILWTSVAIVDVVSVFPDITGQQWCACPVRGVAALLMFSSTSLPSEFYTNQVHPEPKLLAAELVNSSLNTSSESKEFWNAEASLSLGAPCPLGLRQF